MEILGCLAIVFVGMLLGRLGAGGSMLAIPVLLYLFSLDMVTASAYGLFVVGTTSLVGACIRQKEQHIDVRTAILFGLPSITLTFAARTWITGWVPEVVWQRGSLWLTKDDLLLGLFSCVMIASAIAMLVKRNPGKDHKEKIRTLHLLPTGAVVGIVAGCSGAGGGFLIMPAMTFAGLRFRTAVGTTLMIIASNSLLGFCGHLSNAPVDWYLLLPLTALALSGLLMGTLSDRQSFSNETWRRCFAWLSLATGAGILIVLIVEYLT